MAIDSAEVRRIARLAHLDLDEATIEAFTDQLQSILDYVAVLGELDLQSIPPTWSTGELEQRLREDVDAPSVSADEALANAADTGADQFRVPRVLGE